MSFLKTNVKKLPIISNFYWNNIQEFLAKQPIACICYNQAKKSKFNDSEIQISAQNAKKM